MSFWKKKDNLIITAFVGLFFLGLGIWLNLCCVQASWFGSSSSSNPFAISFTDSNHNELNLAQFKGKPVVLNFWATWCPVCVKRMGTLNSFAKKFQDKGGVVLAVSEDRGGLNTVRAYFARHNYSNLDIYLDNTGQLMHAFEAGGLPTSVFIDAEGKEVGRLVGGVDWENPQIDALIEEYFGINLSE